MWFEESIDNVWKQAYKVSEKLDETTSKYQKIEVYQSDFFGKILVIDGHAMLCERDEFAYHEMLAHVPLTVHPDPKRVLIIGGGDGGTAREVLKHPGVHVEMVEIDEAVVKTSQTHFPRFASVWDDPRFTLHIGDGTEFIENAADASYDVILVDSTDPEGPAQGLFGKPFYAHVSRVLSGEGICVAQAESWFLEMAAHKALLETMQPFFRYVMPYRFEMSVYPGVLWNFAFASKKHHPQAGFRVHAADMLEDLSYYNSDIHNAAFALPTYIHRELQGVMKR